jgi:hypothetical protein
MTPEGHPVAGMNTFSAYEEDGAVVAQVQCLVRTNDPFYEISARMGIFFRTEDDFWRHTVEAVAAHFGVNARAETKISLVDPRVQWSAAKNVWHNAAIRTGLYLPVAVFKSLLRRR